MKDEAFTIQRHGASHESISYELSGNSLKVWWNDEEYSVYEKSTFTNSFEALVNTPFKSIQLPSLSMTRVLDKPQYVYSIYILNDAYYIDDVKCSLGDLKSTIQARIAKFNKLDLPYITTHLVMDKNARVSTLYDLTETLRELHIYKIAFGTFPTEGSALQFHRSALAQMLPPMDAKTTDISEIKEHVLVIQPGGNLNTKTDELESFIKSDPKYIISYEWTDDTKYEDYVAIINMNFEVCYKLRDEYAMQKYKMIYTELPSHLQKEARKKYPMRLSQTNTDRK